ncbi:hypothetical protein L1049_016858 [Liquidambar formosana]|uniref:BHLH domain-containing protein n=1 Tax=Liquidambar formosana TaxID=63359 RepID=A0AAP0S0M8_LIQFO
MEYQYLEEELQGEVFWLEAFPVKQSAFVQYQNIPIGGFRLENSAVNSNDRNMNKRMMELLRRRGCTSASAPAVIERREPERERCFRHMINERMRREKHKESFQALHSMLPLGTKNDKNSIIQMTAVKIQELQTYKEELQRQNRELEINLAAMEREKVGGTKIKLRVGNPTSGIDSLVEVLQCLKNLGLETRAIHSKHSAEEFYAELEIETKLIGAAEVENAVQRTLIEAERKLLHHFQEAGWRG